MRSQVLPLLLQRSVLSQAGCAAGAHPQQQLASAAELQGAAACLIVPASSRALYAAAAEPAVAAAVEQGTAAPVATAVADTHAAADAAQQATADAGTAVEPAAGGSSSSDTLGGTTGHAAAAATAASAAASSSSGTGSGTTRAFTEALLKRMGLWLDSNEYKKADSHTQHRLQQLRRCVPMLQQGLPSGFMAAARINGHQLQTVVTPAMNYGQNLHPLEYPRDRVRKAHKAATADAEPAAAGAAAGSEAAAAAANGGSGSDGGRAAAGGRKGRKGVQEKKASDSSSSGGVSSKGSRRAASAAAGNKQQQQQQPLQHLQQLQADGVSLSPASLVVGLNESEIMVNLNAQMSNAAAAGDWKTAVNLFDDLLDRGVAAALAERDQQQQQLQQAQEQQQQQQEGQDAEQQQQAAKQRRQQQRAADSEPLVLPAQYRPDTSAIGTYCRAMVRVADHEHQRFRHYKSIGQDRQEHRDATHARAQQLLYGARRVMQLWDPARDAVYNAAKLGAHVHMAYLAACWAAGRSTEGVSYWASVHPRLQPDILQNFWRLHFLATACALKGDDLEAADKFAQPFAPKDQFMRLVFRKDDYVYRIAPLMQQLAVKTAQAEMWDAALHWLQALIDHDALVPVQPANFLVLLRSAAFAGQMPIARVMIKALDDQLKLQGLPPNVYSEFQCVDLIEAAGKAGDVPFIEQTWERLCHDVQQQPQQQQRQQYGRSNSSHADSDAALLESISGGNGAAADANADADAAPAADASADASASSNEAAGAESGDDSNAPAAAALTAASAKATKFPSADAHLAVIRALVECGAYGKAYEYLHTLEQRCPSSSPTCSVYQGLRFFPESLSTEQKMAAAFAQLQARKDNGQPVSTTMVNVLTRAVARLSSTESVGKVFNSYEQAWGVKHDVDSYNAVMEACEAAGRVAGVQGVLALMTSRDLPPNTASWNLLLSTAVRAGDVRAVTSTVNRMREAKVDPSFYLLNKVLSLADLKMDAGLRAMVTRVATEINPTQTHVIFNRLAHSRRSWASGSGSGSSGGSNGGRRGSAAAGVGVGGQADRWDPSSGSSGSSSKGSSRGGGGGNGSGGGPVDSWRPGGGDSDGQQQQRWRQRSSDAEWGINSRGGVGGGAPPASDRAAQLRAIIGGGGGDARE